MEMKQTKGSRQINWFIPIWIAIILLTIVFAGFSYDDIDKTKLVSNMTIDEIMQNQIQLTVVYGLENSETKGWTEAFLSDVDPWIDLCNDAETIAVVKADGILDLYPGSLGQRVEILEVLKNNEDELSTGQQIEIFLPGGITEPSKQEYQYLLPMGLMEKDAEYLVFLRKSDLNEYQEDKIYIAYSDCFAYINLELKNTPVIELSENNATLDMTRGCDYLSCTKSASEQLDQIRMELVRTWCPDRKF